MRFVIALALVFATALACSPEHAVEPNRSSPSASPTPPATRQAAPALARLPSDCRGSTPEIAATVVEDALALPLTTALLRAEQAPSWIAPDASPNDAALVSTRLNAGHAWMVGFSTPPPFPILGRTNLRFTAWVALIDARSGDFVTAWACGAIAPDGRAPSSPSSAPTPTADHGGLLSRAEALAKVSSDPGDTVTRIDAKLVLRGDVAAASNGIGGVGDADYVWIVARWGEFAAVRFGAPLGVDNTRPQQSAQPDGWRFVLIDARTGRAYLGGANAAEPSWWDGLPDRSADPSR